MFTGKFKMWVRFLAVLWECIFYNVKWGFLLENLILKDKLQMFGFESFFSSPNFGIFGQLQSVLASVVLKVFLVGQPWCPAFLLSLLTIKELPTTLYIRKEQSQQTVRLTTYPVIHFTNNNITIFLLIYLLS